MLRIGAEKDYYNLGEPIFVELKVEVTGRVPVRVPMRSIRARVSSGLSSSGPTDIASATLRLCACACAHATALQVSGGEPLASHPIPLFLAARGPLFTVPGRYRVWTELAGVDGNKVAFANPLDITVVSPDLQTQRFAEKLWTTPGALEAMYLRHPLAEFDAWQEITDAAKRFELAKKSDNTTAAYFDFVGAMGWSRPFQYHRSSPGAARPGSHAQATEGDEARRPPNVDLRARSGDARREARLEIHGRGAEREGTAARIDSAERPVRRGRSRSAVGATAESGQPLHRRAVPQGQAVGCRYRLVEHPASPRLDRKRACRDDRGVHGCVPLRLLGSAGDRRSLGRRAG